MKIIAWWKARLWWVRWITYYATAIVLFYGIEDFRGYRALEQAKEEYFAAGLRLDVDELLGPAIPDEENFAASEIVREAFLDPNGPAARLYPKEDFPELPDTLEDGTTIGFQGNQWRFDTPEAKKDFEQDCLNALKVVAPQVRRFFEAAQRPFCDWRVVTEPADFEAPSPRISLILTSAGILRLFSDSPEPHEDLPISLTEAIVGNLSAAKHIKTNGNLISQLVGSAVMRFCYQSLASGIYAQKFSANDLASIKARLKALEPINENSFVEFELAVTLSRDGHHSDVRRSFLEVMSTGVGIPHLVKIPGNPLPIDLAPAERLINKAIVHVIPRGWIWQGQALYIRFSLDADQKVPPACYTLFLFEAHEYLPKILEKERDSNISQLLSILAVEVESHRLKHESLPTEEQFNTGSPNIGYMIEENGQPMLWYSEDLPLGPPPTGKELEAYDEKHLWRYPPPES